MLVANKLLSFDRNSSLLNFGLTRLIVTRIKNTSEIKTIAGNNSELQIRGGITSDQPLIESLVFPAAERPRPRREHIVPLPQGFYISLRAYFTPAAALEIAYTTFSYLDEYHVSFPMQTRGEIH